MDNSEELIGATEYLTLYKRFRINRYRYNRVRLYSVEASVILLNEVTSTNFSIAWVVSLQERLDTHNDPDHNTAAQAGRHCVCSLLDNIQ
jgi:hypothetical protein